MPQDDKRTRARGVKRQSSDNAAENLSKQEKRPKKAKASILAPAIEDSNKIEFSEQSEATPRRERRSAARDYLNGRISDEEFQRWVQGLIAARSNKASNNKALSVMEQTAKALPTTDFPVYPTEGCNVSGRRLSQMFFVREKQAALLSYKRKITKVSSQALR